MEALRGELDDTKEKRMSLSRSVEAELAEKSALVQQLQKDLAAATATHESSSTAAAEEVGVVLLTPS